MSFIVGRFIPHTLCHAVKIKEKVFSRCFIARSFFHCLQGEAGRDGLPGPKGSAGKAVSTT